jgi:low temperature requirement protein LtrA
VTGVGNPVETTSAITERHASWAELFFDLVAVAGVAALAHVLEIELSSAALGLYVLLFLAFWLSWTTFTLYSNVAASRTHVIRLMIGMFGLGVMATTVPGVTRHVLDGGSGTLPLTVFTVAYIATRLYGAQSWQRSTLLLDFPIVQYSGGLLPWLASIWVDDPWKLRLWALGLAIDLVLTVLVSGDKLLSQFQARTSTRAARRPRRSTGTRTSRKRPAIQAVSVDPVHLSERLGLFVIVVLGESVVQVVAAAADAELDVNLLATGAASFVLLAALFGLSVVFGHAGLPHLRAGRISARPALGLHCLVTGVVATVAVSLSAVVADGSDPLPTPERWLLCGAVASYFALGVLTGVASHSSDRMQTTSRITTGIVIPLVLGLFATDVSGRNLVIFLAVVALAHLWFERRSAPARTGESLPP